MQSLPFGWHLPRADRTYPRSTESPRESSSNGGDSSSPWNESVDDGPAAANAAAFATLGQPMKLDTASSVTGSADPLQYSTEGLQALIAASIAALEAQLQAQARESEDGAAPEIAAEMRKVLTICGKYSPSSSEVAAMWAAPPCEDPAGDAIQLFAPWAFRCFIAAGVVGLGFASAYFAPAAAPLAAAHSFVDALQDGADSVVHLTQVALHWNLPAFDQAAKQLASISVSEPTAVESHLLPVADIMSSAAKSMAEHGPGAGAVTALPPPIDVTSATTAMAIQSAKASSVVEAPLYSAAASLLEALPVAFLLDLCDWQAEPSILDNYHRTCQAAIGGGARLASSSCGSELGMAFL